MQGLSEPFEGGYMKKVRISIIAIIVLLVLLFFVMPVQSQDNEVKRVLKINRCYG